MKKGVKFCGMTNEAEIQMAASAGVNAVGVMVRPDSTYHERSEGSHSVSIEIAARLARTTPMNVEFVAVTNTGDYDEITEIADRIGPDRLQLGKTEDPELAVRLRQRYRTKPYPCLAQVIRVDSDAGPLLVDEFPVQCIHLDSPGPLPGGNGLVHDWQKSVEFAARAREKGKIVVLAGGLKSDIVEGAIKTVQPHQLDVETGIRTDGVCDLEKMKLFARNAREARAA